MGEITFGEPVFDNISSLDRIYSTMIKNNCMNDDPEMDHVKADQYLMELLSKLGFTETADAFHDVYKWYA